jgi:hypothetical protein
VTIRLATNTGATSAYLFQGQSVQINGNRTTNPC